MTHHGGFLTLCSMQSRPGSCLVLSTLATSYRLHGVAGFELRVTMHTLWRLLARRR